MAHMVVEAIPLLRVHAGEKAARPPPECFTSSMLSVRSSTGCRSSGRRRDLATRYSKRSTFIVTRRRRASDACAMVEHGEYAVTRRANDVEFWKRRVPRAPSELGPSAQSPREAFFAFLAWRFSFRVADASFLFFFPPFSFDAIRGLLTDCGQAGRAAPIAYRHFADDERRIAVGVTLSSGALWQQRLTRDEALRLAEALERVDLSRACLWARPARGPRLTR